MRWDCRTEGLKPTRPCGTQPGIKLPLHPLLPVCTKRLQPPQVPKSRPKKLLIRKGRGCRNKKGIVKKQFFVFFFFFFLRRMQFHIKLVCGLSCPMACEILLPGPGIKPASSALEGRFVTTRPPGKFQETIILW